MRECNTICKALSVSFDFYHNSKPFRYLHYFKTFQLSFPTAESRSQQPLQIIYQYRDKARRQPLEHSIRTHDGRIREHPGLRKGD